MDALAANYSVFLKLPPEIGVFLLSMLPIAELRIAIPFAIGVYKMPVLPSYFISVAGNIFPVFFILLFLEKISQFLTERSEIAKRFFDWLFCRTRKKFFENYERWGALALVIFVAIPLPFTGAWTGAVAAYLFGIPRKKAFVLISIGVAIAGLIVSLLTIGAIKIAV